MKELKTGGGYFDYLDIAKGIGILLVIMGHCIFPSHILIDVFHMPLFFLIAGITFHRKPDANFLIGKVNRIGIPYCFWLIVSAFASKIPHPYSGAFNAPLWFLQTIFVSLIIMQVGSKLNKTLGMIYWGVLLVLSYICILNNYQFLPFCLPRCIVGFLYIFIGYKLAQILNAPLSLLRMVAVSILFLLSFGGLFLFLLREYNLSGAFFNLTLYTHNYPLTIICSLLGILFTISVAKLIKANSLLCWLGKNSLVIMCVHFPFAQILNVYISSLSQYDSTIFRSGAALCEYLIVTMISSFFVIICKRYVPSLTGYKPLIKY